MVKNSRDLKNISLEDKVYDTIVKNDLIKNGDKIVVAVSGGPDSMCLLNVLNNLKEQFKKYNNIDYSLVVAHVNHMIREESEDEKVYVEQYCKRLGISFNYLKVNVTKEAKKGKISTEMCGRKIRYEFFNEVLKKENATKIAVAHNSLDNVETIILNLSRGTGLKGLCGISYKTQNIIRPLLDISREEIEEYGNNNNLNAKIDKTNMCDIYLRNKVRLNVIPTLKQNLGKNICDSILKTRKILIKEEEFLSQYTNNIIKSAIIENNNLGISFNINTIIKLHEAIATRCIREIIKMCISDLNGISSTHIEDIYKILVEHKKGKMFVYGSKFCIEIITKDIAKISKIS